MACQFVSIHTLSTLKGLFSGAKLMQISKNSKNF